METRVSLHYGTHLPLLMQAMERTSGPVLEMGLGVFSTPYLHYQCLLSKRKLVSYDNYKEWCDFFIKYGYRNKYHEIIHVEKWEDAAIEKIWHVVLIDHSPDYRRREDVKRVANSAKYIIIHDSNEDGRHKFSNYKYDEIFPLFKHKKVWVGDGRHSTVLSNLVDLEGFNEK